VWREVEEDMAEVDRDRYVKALEGREHTDESDEKRKEGLIRARNERAVNSVQKAWAFDKRGKRTRFYLKVLTFSGVAVPAVVGGIVLSFAAGVQEAWFTRILAVAGKLSIAQIVLALWALSAKRDDAHAYATESVAANRALYRRYYHLAISPRSTLGSMSDNLSSLTPITGAGESPTTNKALAEERKGLVTGPGYAKYESHVQTAGKNPRRCCLTANSAATFPDGKRSCRGSGETAKRWKLPSQSLPKNLTNRQ
jgi:hypothetical protein